jgi:hypothetical protein
VPDSAPSTGLLESVVVTKLLLPPMRPHYRAQKR